MDRIAARGCIPCARPSRWISKGCGDAPTGSRLSTGPKSNPSRIRAWASQRINVQFVRTGATKGALAQSHESFRGDRLPASRELEILGDTPHARPLHFRSLRRAYPMETREADASVASADTRVPALLQRDSVRPKKSFCADQFGAESRQPEGNAFKHRRCARSLGAHHQLGASPLASRRNNSIPSGP